MTALRTDARTAPQHDLTPPAPPVSPELSGLKDGFRYGLALGFVVGLAAALIVFVGAIVLTGGGR